MDVREHLLAGLPVGERRLELTGVSTAVLEGGTGAPLVLLHGPGGSAAHWLRVIPALTRAHRVVAPDLPGQGASELTGGQLDEAGVLAWLGELIEATCPSPPTVVGAAFGGAMAARFAAERGERLARLVLVDTLGLVPFAPAPVFGQALQAFLAEPTGSTHDRLWEHCAHDLDALRSDPAMRWDDFRAYNVQRAQDPEAMASLGTLMQLFGFPAVPADELARIAVPTALIWGRHDLATPLRVAHAASVQHGWPLHVIEDCADDPPVEQPAAFVAALEQALEATQRQPSAAAVTP